MTLRSAFIAAAAALLLAGPAPAAGEEAVDAKAAFERLKKLAGEWEGDTPNGKARLTIDVIANGTTIVEREQMAKAPDMVTMYHLDGNRLLLTHYCMAGNQPRMQARRFDAKTGELRFDFIDATNLPSETTGHMRAVSMRLVDDDHLTSEWQFYENGKPAFVEGASYSRIR
jgi:hypothetical protein